MPSRTNRQEARQRLDALFHSLCDKYIPADGSVPLQGGKFIDWEDQADPGLSHVAKVLLGLR